MQNQFQTLYKIKKILSIITNIKVKKLSKYVIRLHYYNLGIN